MVINCTEISLGGLVLDIGVNDVVVIALIDVVSVVAGSISVGRGVVEIALVVYKGSDGVLLTDRVEGLVVLVVVFRNVRNPTISVEKAK